MSDKFYFIISLKGKGHVLLDQSQLARTMGCIENQIPRFSLVG